MPQMSSLFWTYLMIFFWFSWTIFSMIFYFWFEFNLGLGIEYNYNWYFSACDISGIRVVAVDDLINYNFMLS